jgi:hypothetical protein
MSTPTPHRSNTKRIVCLANSRKVSGRCIAGREIGSGSPGPWIRPVSDREHEEVSEHERQYEDGSDPTVLDIIDIPLIAPRPHLFQQENWLLDGNFYWERRGRCDWADLQKFLEQGSLWINYLSSYNGLNDRVDVAQAQNLTNSLRLIHVNSLDIKVFCPGSAFGNPKRRVQGQFQHERIQYWLWVTDPTYERRFLAQPNGCYSLGESCLTISLGEPHEGFCYSLLRLSLNERKLRSDEHYAEANSDDRTFKSLT